MSDDVQTLVTVVGLLLLLGLCLTPFVIFFVYVFYQSWKRKRIVNRVLASNQPMVDNQPWFPVRYASAPRFKAWFKIFPWEGAGIVVITRATVLFLGETLSGTSLNLQFAAANTRINWLGKCPWPNGAVSWFEFDVTNEKHYFSSETGAFVFGSNKSTKAIYDAGDQALTGQPQTGI